MRRRLRRRPEKYNVQQVVVQLQSLEQRVLSCLSMCSTRGLFPANQLIELSRRNAYFDRPL
jgi:hypothetical protein